MRSLHLYEAIEMDVVDYMHATRASHSDMEWEFTPTCHRCGRSGEETTSHHGRSVCVSCVPVHVMSLD